MNKWTFIAATALTVSVFAPMQTEAATNTYTVQSGDTLSKIAAKYAVSISQLKEWNQLSRDQLSIGQQLIVSKAIEKKKGALIASTKKSAVNVRPSNDLIAREDVEEEQHLTHLIVKGDTLTKIAQLYGVTISDIKLWNNLKSDVIYIGQTLRISSIRQDDIVPDITFENEIISEVDQKINNQLASERTITSSPSANGLQLYSKVLEMGHSLKGIPYVFGGNTVAGFDCSGYINYVFSKSGMKITRKSSADYFMNDSTEVTNPLPGDLVFFKNTYMAGISHMGIYIGNNEFLHAGSKGVEVSKLTYTYWKERFVAFKRFNEVK